MYFVPLEMMGNPHWRYEYAKPWRFGKIRACVVWQGKIFGFGVSIRDLHRLISGGVAVVLLQLRKVRHRKNVSIVSGNATLETAYMTDVLSALRIQPIHMFQLFDDVAIKFSFANQAFTIPDTTQSVVSWRSS